MECIVLIFRGECTSVSGDTIQVIGTDEQLGEFARQAERVSAAAEEEDLKGVK